MLVIVLLSPLVFLRILSSSWCAKERFNVYYGTPLVFQSFLYLSEGCESCFSYFFCFDVIIVYIF